MTPSRARLTTLAAGAALAGLLGATAPAVAQSSDDLTVTWGAAQAGRTLLVQDPAGGELEQLSVADGTGAFRVQVVDESMEPSPFAVVSEMTDLYRDGVVGGADEPIPSSAVAVSPAGPASVLGLRATVDVAGNVAGTLAEPLCTEVTVLGVPCTIDLGTLSATDQVVDLAGATLDPALAPLSLSRDGGTYDSPSFAGPAAADSRAAGAPDATNITLLSGAEGAGAGFLPAVQAAVNGLAGPAVGVVDDGTLRTALRDSLGTSYDMLSAVQVDDILASLAFTPVTASILDVDGIDGTWQAYHDLAVTAPDGAAGAYAGTLIVTLVQLGQP